MTCYGVLGQVILFHVLNVCKLSSTKPYLYNVSIWIAGSNYIPDPYVPGFFSDIELYFNTFLLSSQSLSENHLHQFQHYV